MPELTLHYPDGRTETRRVESGTRLLDAVEPAYRTAPCGGNGRCGKCRVQATGCLSEPQEQEKSLLGDDLLRGWRLACLTRVAGDAEVTLHQTAQLREICADGELPPFVRQPLFTRYGAAVDIGTTTLAAQLYDHDGRRLAQAVAANPQAVFGADVISRIEKSLAGEREALMCCIRRGIDGLLAELSASAGVSPSDIDAVVVTGNTTMLYLLTGRSVDCLARAPFAADELFGRWAQAGEVELASVPSARVYLPRCMSAFVGADITTALLCSGLCERPNSALLADIGTNGELALWHGGRLRCCSTAAGPVFEGAGISCGMQGVAGAVSHVLWENGAVRCRRRGAAGYLRQRDHRRGGGILRAGDHRRDRRVYRRPHGLCSGDGRDRHAEGHPHAAAGQERRLRRHPDAAGGGRTDAGGADGAVGGRRLRDLSGHTQRGGHRSVSGGAGGQNKGAGQCGAGRCRHAPAGGALCAEELRAGAAGGDCGSEHQRGLHGALCGLHGVLKTGKCRRGVASPAEFFSEYKQRERRRTGIVAHRRRLFMPSFGYFDRKMRNNLVTYPCRTALTFARLADTIKKKWKRYR